MRTTDAGPEFSSRAPASLETISVSIHYRNRKTRVTALDDVSLRIRKGSFGLLRGASGSGKSTLLAVFGAMVRPKTGKIFINGEEITRASSHQLARTRRRLGFIFQNLALLPRMSAWENVAVPLIAEGVPYGERRERAESLLARFGLVERAESNVTELSGGEQQRVALARALAGSPDILLADEPTASLDDDCGEQIAGLLTELNRQGTTVVVASHDERFENLATEAWTLKRGQLATEPFP